MNQENIFNHKNIKTILFIAILIMVLSLIFNFLQTPKYKSSAKLLVIFNQNNMDVYTASQNSNYIAGILYEVIYSNSFIDEVFKTNFDLKDQLGFNQAVRLKTWKKMVRVRILENKGIILIDVLNKDKEQANQFAQAISYTLITQHNLYHGSDQKVDIKIINNPTVAQHWDQPKVIKNTFLGLMAGLIVGFTFIIIFPQQELLAIIFKPRKTKNRDQTIDLVQTDETDENNIIFENEADIER